MNRPTQLYHLYKASEGGIAQRDTLAHLKSHDIKVRVQPSHLMGCYAIEVTGGQRVQAKVKRLLFRP